MGIKNFISEFQDYFFIKRSILESLDKTRLSSSNLEVAYKQTEALIEEFKTNLEFLDTETVEVYSELEDIINSLNSKIDKINLYSEAIKDINATEDDVKNIIEIYPYELNKNNKNWEYNTKSYILEPKSSYMTLKAYTNILDSSVKRGISKFVLDDTFATKYLLINKDTSITISNILYFNSNRELLTSNDTTFILENSNVLKIPNNTKYINIEYGYDTNTNLTITPLSFYHHPTSTITLPNHTYDYGSLFSFNVKKDIPFGCFLQIKFKCTFKDINGNVLLTEDFWYPIDNDGRVVLKKKEITTEVPERVWLEESFKDITDLDTLNDDNFIVCKPNYTENISVNTESSFKFNVRNAKTITVQPTLYMYSLLNETLTPRLFTITGIMKK